ncbi:MAG: hypothetical protein RSE00_03130 [Clostridia bacterium]
MKKEEISLKNTKAEILNALNDALEKEKNISTIKSNPEKEDKEKSIKKAIETSKVNVEQKIFSEELNNKFKELEKAIESEEEKLKNLYGIEKELQNITLVINAGKDCMAQVEYENKAKTEELNNELEILEKSFKQKNIELQKDYDVTSKNLKIERDREIEEYNYKQKRERELQNNKWTDEKQQRELKLSKVEEDAKRLLNEATQKVEYIKELEMKVNEIPKLLQKEYERGRSEITKELKCQHEHQVELYKKDYESTKNRLDDKVESLTQELAKSINLNSLLQEKLDKSYVEIKELATKTVESAGGVKIIGNTTNENK